MNLPRDVALDVSFGSLRLPKKIELDHDKRITIPIFFEWSRLSLILTWSLSLARLNPLHIGHISSSAGSFVCNAFKADVELIAKGPCSGQ